ncbi:hypothetical protein [Mameliella alba]|uniref:Uncharacterized protein n=1 Tax=Mameliella alba TaxID=561184 RepID=A0A0B3RGB6_9RHOB|nr:hypothetical protein [Mameliella alba]KHQ50315.1 hypothetical protein OA50_05163 [Mameliella alba]
MTTATDTLAVDHLGNGWYVVDASGDPVTGRYSFRAEAEIRLDKIRRRAASKVRPCLSCGTRFASEGPHNRLCTPCRRADLSPWAP